MSFKTCTVYDPLTSTVWIQNHLDISQNRMLLCDLLYILSHNQVLNEMMVNTYWIFLILCAQLFSLSLTFRSCLSYVVLFQSPPKGATIPYRPKPATTPIIFSGGQVRADTLGAPTTANLSLLLQHQPLPVSMVRKYTSVVTPTDCFYIFNWGSVKFIDKECDRGTNLRLHSLPHY